MTKRLNLIAQKFGELTVESFAGINKNRRTLWLCKCSCDNLIVVLGNSLKSGNTQSCGCIKNIHNKSGSPVYVAWNNMIQRCYNKNSHNYYNYGKCGIIVCKRWHQFKNFYEDMGDKPDKLSLDRIKNELNYSCGHCEECLQNGWKFNCRWATQKIQARNMSTNRLIKYNGEIHCLQEWSEIINIPANTLAMRLDRWSLEKAFTEPLRPY